MAYENNQNEYPLPADGKKSRQSETLLPRYFRTDINKKFLQSTLDQLTQPGVAEKLNGYYGRIVSKAYNADDNYVGDITQERQDYQFEPAVLVKDDLENVTYYKDYNDYLNQLKTFGGNVKNQDLLNSQENYSWNANIDWDKFTNFREYYWLPYGPQTIRIAGQARGIESTIGVTLANNLDNSAFVFSTDELVQNPTLILYRGQKYTFEIDTLGTPISIKTKRTLDDSFKYNDGIDNQSVEQGKITFDVSVNAPEILYYVADNDINNSGLIQIKDIEENTEINIEKEILGKRKYKTESGVELSNGMKVSFAGFVTPEKYAKSEWYIEGVGSSIKLIAESDLEIPAGFSENKDIPFDVNAFDRLPFDNATGYASSKDYIVINRSSADRNSWSRHNRWFHRDVIELAAKINNQEVSVDQSARATRPIIEFNAGLKLFNFGTQNKSNVDLVDTFTTDIFSNVEGALGYSIDGVKLVDGMRVLFTAEEDIREAGKIFKIKFLTHKGRRQISLIEESDALPLENETVLVLNGQNYQGKMFYYNGTSWSMAQEKLTVNQQPLFDLFDESGNSYGNTEYYPNSTFTGNKIFSYRQGTGIVDAELGFPLSYRSIENIGDLVFDFNLLTDSFTYTNGLDTLSRSTDVCVLQKYSDRTTFQNVNGWTKTDTESRQRVLRQYVAEQDQTDFEVDVYENSGSLDDLIIRVTVNNSIKFNVTDFEIIKDQNAIVRFNTPLETGDVVVLRTRSSAVKNNNGLYELPSNLEKNPANDDITSFTLGEVNDHVASIAEDAEEFFGSYPGRGNLRDLGDISKFGRKFLQHSGPINLSLYHITNKDANIIKAIDFSRREYAKFKRLFIQTADSLGFDGTPKAHVDLIFRELNKNKNNNLPFYFSDMAPTSGAKQLVYEIFEEGNIYFALNQPYSLDTISQRAVNVYVNDVQLIFEDDYTFNEEGFCIITYPLAQGDIVEIYEYDSTDGCYIPPTPTKLGIYPKYVPSKFVDNTYIEPTEVIQGHDGSITKAYGDYRDDLILELEKRIYNNLKVQYDDDIIDIYEYQGGEHRNTGFSRTDINSTMLKDFASWLSVVGDIDYTTFDFYNRNNSFTYNYGSMESPSGELLPGFWRAVYKYAYDTDRPHTHPWEMLGFSIKPKWWEEKYGPAPYTSNNLIMWEDLEKGVIAEPNKNKIIKTEFMRPGLTSHLPVNNQGQLLSPLDSKYARNYVNSFTRRSFSFGDHAPAETAWRKSSEYPFSLLKSWMLNQPSKIIGLSFDRLRTVRNSAGQLVYSETNKRLRLADLVFPTSPDSDIRVYSSGLINFISNYLASNILVNFNSYKENLSRITNQMAFKVGGFTDKTKFNLILDSRTPLNKGNVFVPEENFDVVLTTSSPIELVSYSAVVVEKSSAGYIIRGYDATSPVFKYFNYVVSDSDPEVNVGGISETFIEWDSNKRYLKGTVVSYNNRYFRTTDTHTSSTNFDGTKFASLPTLPVVGGRSALFRRSFETRTVQELPYGTVLKTSQEVVDFLLGYGEYLESLGFTFDNHNSEIESVENWKLSAREFLFWTTQNWDPGSLISLSPSAQKVSYKNEYAVVDDIFDSFYDYGIVKADGTKLQREFCNISRTQDNAFELTLKNTADGLYALKLPVVRKEHVVILDNETVFKDTIYDPAPGYRQERIRVLGYRTADWSGGLNIPGFIYDQATVTEWTPWKDYSIGDVVKYKEFYYTATTKISGVEFFNNANWYKLNEKPQPGLVTNLEYKTNQFADFYDLDTDNFDVNQQEIAQHLIGYQKREYLANIINDDVSQYKFYQGMIADKGTKNALTKLFDALGAADKESLEFYEEWAVKVGQYGAADGFEEVEFLLEEDKFRLSPQPILLVDSISGSETDLVYRQTPDNVYLKPSHYDHTPFPTKYRADSAFKTAGYVRESDVQWTVKNKDDILTLDLQEVKQGDYIWVTFEGQEWNVYKHIGTQFRITTATPLGTTAILTLDKLSNFVEGDIIGIIDVVDIDGFYKVVSSELNQVTIELGEASLTQEETGLSGTITKFVSNRVATLTDSNQYAENNIDPGELLWIDNIDNTLTGKWNVIKAEGSYNFDEDLVNPTITDQSYGESITSQDDGTFVAVGSPLDGDGKVYVYKREDDGSTVNGTLSLVQTIQPTENFSAGSSKFGEAVTMSPDGKYLIVGAPNSTYVKSAYKDNFNLSSNYTRGSIVQYNNSLYKARRTVKARTDNVVFGTFDSASRWRSELYKLYGDYTDIKLLATGDVPLIDTTTDHILVRAPIDAYEGSNIGDRLYLGWDNISHNYNPISEVSIVGIDLSASPMKLITDTAHNLEDNDEIIITDVPNDNITILVDQFDNSDPNIPFDTLEQEGVKGLENVKFFVKVLGNDYLEIYYDEDLTLPVNPNIGFSGEPIGPRLGSGELANPLGGDFNGFLRKINKPFNNKLPGIDKTFFETNVHTIRRKVEEVFYVVDPLNIPSVSAGDTVTTPTGNATVVYVKNELGRLVVYANDKNGIFEETGTLYINDTFLIGEYTRPLHEPVDRSSILGGYWEIATGFNYNPNGIITDNGHGLVIKDIKNNFDPNTFSNPDATWHESVDILPYKNSIDTRYEIPVEILAGVDKPFQKETDIVRVLSHQSRGIAGAGTQTFLDNRWIVRLPKNVSDKATSAFNDPQSPSPYIGVWLNDIPGTSGTLPDLSAKGFGDNPYNIINKVQVPVDLWDGYIDYDIFAEIDLVPGDIVREGTTGATAEVVLYQRDLDKARIYVKNVTGDFSFGSRYIDGLAPTSMYLNKDEGNGQLRRIGTTESRQLADSDIGKIAVFQHTEQLPLPERFILPLNANVSDEIGIYETEFISGIEYLTWIEEFKPGLPRTPLVPSNSNNDWEEVDNIPINTNRAASEVVREGAFFVYEKDDVLDRYNFINGFILPNREEGRELASSLKIIQSGDFYKLVINSKETHTNDITTNPGRGRLYFVVNGTDIYGKTYNWTVGRDTNFKGIYSNVSDYYQDQIVVYNNVFYRALTNIQAEEFNSNKWKVLGDHVDFIGYLPNTTGLVIPSDIESIADLTTTAYGRTFDISDSGNILATIAEYSDRNKLVIYRLKNSHFEIIQEFDAPLEARSYGESVVVSDDGNIIAVGAPNTDADQPYQGRVYVYKNVNGTYQQSQILNSPNKEQTEGFGINLGFDGNQLVVTSARGDIILDTTYDRFQDTSNTLGRYVNDPNSPLSPVETIFDKGFTKFAKRIVDSGVVYIYENINNSLVYGQRLEYTDFSVVNFGKDVLVKNNKIYVGLPTINNGSGPGKVAVYHRQQDQKIWNVIRSPIDQPEVDKFRGSFIYNTKTNLLLSRLDIIDPVAGKISGLAEQELSYKTYFDPAFYNVGNQTEKTKYTTWGEKQVGELWWDLSTVKYVDYNQGSVIYSQSVWGSLATGSSIDVYEWVESNIAPDVWDQRADTNLGSARGISGTSKYGTSKYVEKDVYDPISQGFVKKYYFWVKNKRVTPDIESRRRSSYDVANIIRDPAGQRLKFVTILGNDRFILYNCNKSLSDSDVAINFRYWTIDNQENNIHNEYQIISEGLSTSKPKSVIEDKWIDSLIGSDKYHRPVPDPTLSVKQKYGSLNRPRQSWFVNRQEALKQYVERVNRVLKDQLILDNFDTTKLFEKDPVPTFISGHYDTAIDTEQELEFVGTVRAATAILQPVIEDGVVTSVTIVNGGRGYRIAPTIKINGTGENLELKPILNNLGIITSVEIINGGTNYTDSLTLTVRPLSVLVRADSTNNGGWTIYGWNPDTRVWSITNKQYYDVSEFWKYKDWYLTGYSALTGIDFLIDDYYQLSGLNDDLGDIIKISNVGSGGWILLEKIVNLDSPDLSTGYRTVGREGGTIEFLSKLYLEDDNAVELRKIIETIRDDIFVDELAEEYNQLFFASLRYVFAEQNYVDWAFKTSFIKAKHNVGTLEQRTTFQNDNLESYEDYVNEVKPYKAKIREYLSSYDTIDNTQSVTTDFDLAPFYDKELNKIVAPEVAIQDGVLIGINFDETLYPAKHWLDNFTFEVEAIEIQDGGTGFTQVPNVIISGGGGTGAKAKAFIGSGSVKSIVITDPGSGYTSPPSVEIVGTQEDGGLQPRLSVILGNNKVKHYSITQKFDRTSPNYEFLNLSEVEEFTSGGIELKLTLKWPMDLTRANIKVFFDGTEALSSEYSYNNETIKQKQGTKTYTRQLGYITLTQAQPVGTVIRVEYNKSYNLLNAADRINTLYNPETGQYGKDLGQLMSGVDYGGVEVRSFEFGSDLGFDSQPWYTSAWDTYDENFEDETFYTDGSTKRFQLSKPLEAGEQYNVYINGIRVDDVNYDGSTRTYLAEDGVTIVALGNPNAIMKTVTTEESSYVTDIDDDGNPRYFVVIENVEEFEEYYTDTAFEAPKDQVVVIRKASSDGSFLPASGFDSLIEGGNLAYGTATGLDAADITIDGDGFITPTTSAGPEELVPGQLLDTLDMKVYDRAGDGSSLITTRNYTATATINQEFFLETLPHNKQAVIVKVNGSILEVDEDYEINFVENKVVMNNPLTVGDRINISSIGDNGEALIDISAFTGTGEKLEFITNVVYRENLSSYITIDGVNASASIYETDNGMLGLRFVTAPPANSFIHYSLFDATNAVSGITSYSEITIDKHIGDGSTVIFNTDPAPFSKLPLSHNIVVRVDNKILYPGYTQHWFIESGREYPLDSAQFGPSTLSPDQVDVYINGEKLGLLTDYRWDFANTQVVLFDNVGQIGDDLEIFVPYTSEYSFSQNTEVILANVNGSFVPGETVEIGTGDSTIISATVKTYNNNRLELIGPYPELVEQFDDDPSIPVEGTESGAISNNMLSVTLIEAGDNIVLNDIPAQDAEIVIYKFSKHDIQDLQIETRVNAAQGNLVAGTDDYYDFRRLNNGLIKLRQPAISTAYLWVTLNGELLTPNVDYRLSKMDEYVQIIRKVEPDDRIQVIHFAGSKTNAKFGYRMFKDMLNRTHYKRLNQDKVYLLAQPLGITDKVIELDDATGLTLPSTELNIPGVLFIDGERIEYFQVDGNTVSQLRRGTLGTSPKLSYIAGTEIMDQGITESIPYTDEMVTLIKLEDESTQIVLDWIPTKGVDEFEVFVSGKRLRKNAISAYQFQKVDSDGNLIQDFINQDSPEGDTILPPEFELTITDDNVAIITLLNSPEANSRVLIVRKIGKLWQNPGEQLRYAKNSIAEFIRGATTELPK